jgi:hypothetical protein
MDREIVVKRDLGRRQTFGAEITRFLIDVGVAEELTGPVERLGIPIEKQVSGSLPLVLVIIVGMDRV